METNDRNKTYLTNILFYFLLRYHICIYLTIDKYTLNACPLMDLKIKIRIRKKKPELKIKIENRLENLSGTNRRVFQAIYIYWKALL